jgi:hypothetical protein
VRKRLSFNRRRLAIDCAVVLALHAILFQVVAHTRIVERVMAFQFNRWELAVIVAFFVTRLLAYLVVPATVAALAAGEMMERLRRRDR